ncbi:MAG: YybH family protein [Geminicoccaceae bacterium]
MKSLGFAALAFLGLLTLPMVAHAESAKSEVTAAYQAWDKAFATGDPAKIAAFYTGDALFLPPSHDVMRGPAGVEKFYTGLFANGVTGHKLELIEVIGAETDKTLGAAAKWSAQGKDSKGAPTTFSGVTAQVFERQPDGSLKLKLHTFN